MDELSSPAAAIDITNAARWVLKRPSRPSVLRKALFLLVVALASVSSLHAQPATPARPATAPKAIFTPRPEYREEWARRGLTGKGVVLVTIDKQTGKVTAAEMVQSTGNKLLDGSALEAYSRWRFDPRTVAVSQLKIPIEFAKRPTPQPAKRTLPQPVILLIVLAIAGAAIGFLRRRRA
jgi:TonB family protein